MRVLCNPHRKTAFNVIGPWGIDAVEQKCYLFPLAQSGNLARACIIRHISGHTSLDVRQSSPESPCTILLFYWRRVPFQPAGDRSHIRELLWYTSPKERF